MKLRKILSSVIAGSLAVSALTFAVSADAKTVLDFEDGVLAEGVAIFDADGGDSSVVTVGDINGGKAVKVDVQDTAKIPKLMFDLDVILGSNLDKAVGVTLDLTFEAADAGATPGWIGGGVGVESKTHSWQDKAYDGGEYNNQVSETISVSHSFDAFAADDTEAKMLVMRWAATPDYNMYVDNVKFLDADGNALELYPVAAVEEETTTEEAVEEEATEEEAVEEEATEEEVVEEETAEEEAVEEEAAEGFALEECYNNGTVILVADDGQNAYATSNGIDITSVYGYRVTTQFPVAETTVDETWIGGGIGANSNSTGWASTEWGKASGEKPIVAEFDENGVCVIELLGDAPVFAADDAYAQLWIQCWGGTMNIISVDVLGEGGSVIASATVGELAAAEAPEAEEAPAAGDVDASTDSSKGSPDTGVADVAAVAGIAVVAAGAFIVAKKRK